MASDGGSTVVEIRLSPGNERDTVHGHAPALDRAYGGSTRLPAESFGLTPAAPPKGNRAAPWNRDREAHKGRNMVERVFNRMKHHRKAATRHDRLDETLLANPWPILIAIYLKNTAKTQLV